MVRESVVKGDTPIISTHENVSARYKNKCWNEWGKMEGRLELGVRGKIGCIIVGKTSIAPHHQLF